MKDLFRSPAFHVAVLSLLVVAIYANSLSNGFNIDDPNILLDNEAVHGLSLKNVRAAFTSVPNSVEYLPVRDLTYMLDHEVWGLRPFGFHLSNLLYYLLACLSLYLFTSRLLRVWSDDGGRTAFFAAVIFAVHPVHVESVAGIAQRKDLISGIFFFLSLWAFVAYRDKGPVKLYALSLCLFIVAFLSKATAVALPLVVMVLNHLHLRDEDAGVKPTVRVAETAAFFALAAVLTALSLGIARGAGLLAPSGAGIGAGVIERLPSAFVAVFYYLKLLAAPYPLTVWHEFAALRGALEPVVLLCVAGVAVLLVLSHIMRNERVLSFSILFYLVCLVPVVGLLGSSTVVAERYLFLPSAGFAMALAWAVSINFKARPVIAKITAAGFMALVLIFSSLVVIRNPDWKSSGTLIEAGLEKSPSSYRLNLMLGRYHFINRRYEKAMGLFERAARIDPRDTDYVFHRALLLYYRGDFHRALTVLEDSGLLRADVIDAHYLSGLIYSKTGRMDRANESYKRALGGTMMKGIYFKRDAREALEAGAFNK